MERIGKKENTNRKALFTKTIGEKERLKLKAQRNRKSVWAGLGLFGMVGWSVAVPTLLGVALGVWLDKKLPERFSWTLSGLLTGIMAGCLIAWNWVKKERNTIQKNTEDNHE